jgi:hypothetical protein
VAFTKDIAVVDLLAARMLTSSVRSMNTCRSASTMPETTVGRGRQKRACASSANTRSKSELVCMFMVRRRKLDRVRAASSVVVWVRWPARMSATAVACAGDRGGSVESASIPPKGIAN